jgi:hypothetical protein
MGILTSFKHKRKVQISTLQKGYVVSAKETIIIHDLSAEKGPSSTDRIIDHQLAVQIGFRAAAGYVFRAASPEEVAAHAQNHPAAHARLRQNVEENLAERASWGQLPEGYTPPVLAENSDTTAA